jgi:hypothetical protein
LIRPVDTPAWFLLVILFDYLERSVWTFLSES